MPNCTYTIGGVYKHYITKFESNILYLILAEFYSILFFFCRYIKYENILSISLFFTSFLCVKLIGVLFLSVSLNFATPQVKFLNENIFSKNNLDLFQCRRRYEQISRLNENFYVCTKLNYTQLGYFQLALSGKRNKVFFISTLNTELDIFVFISTTQINTYVLF